MATRNANNVPDFGTQFGGTTLTVFDTPRVTRRRCTNCTYQDMEKSPRSSTKVSTFLLLLVRLVAVHLKFT